MKDRKVGFIDTVHVSGNGSGFHLRGVAVPDIKDMVAFILVCTNQISIDRDVITQQRIGHYTFAASEVFT
ncbi:hypothetical protein VY86_21675 [Photorhabdus thracensis]|uniref:Uncharacterized protein n=1 Tax=Photorhabdus thracensis TaxID=230089 RepID=A0A0F7LQP2_9GAMM|nr:hypothetical protein VY86_21675 [Photorhabdus thracensis]